jgi:hypothetical protein
MTSRYTVWFVDDLPKNLRDFETNHASDFNIKTFAKPSEVLSRIRNKEYPHALLIDVFFYETAERAQEVENEVAELAQKLKEAATKLGLMDHRYAAGITLMENIYDHFNKQPPPFPMYAYTSKGPFLLEQKDWQKISGYGAEVLLKGKVTPQSEVTEIVGDIETSIAKNSWTAWIQRGFFKSLFSLWAGFFWLIIGSVGTWLFQKVWRAREAQ